jgi:hypothetical protein
MFIAKDLAQFKKLFVEKLKNMLSDDELGAFILVLANSQQDLFLKRELADDLENTYETLKEKFSNGEISVTQDDSDVFKRLLNVETEKVPVWKNRPLGVWEVACNSMRKLRPARTASQALTSIKQPYDEASFHFNKPFLKPEILWEGEHLGKTFRVLYNKFPFSNYHLLISVEPETNCSQFLTQETHQAIYSLAQSSAKIFPGFGIGFNSLAAGASVNHLHFQGFIREALFPIENKCWQHNDGNISYPLIVERFTDAGSSWCYVEQLIDKNIAFNCVYRNNVCYVIPRRYQGTVELPEWLEGAGWLDVAGVITMSDENSFNSIDEVSVTEALMLLSM